jgi:hypothetical protein
MRYVLKFWSWGDDFTIKNADGQDAFFVDASPHFLSRKNPARAAPAFVTRTEKTPPLDDIAELSGDQLPETRFDDCSTL